jgi:hypothetical protein|tara:strand:- start:414 stop:857 length:444 start_codon:yes stop_codon:yes gene_type:complete
MGRPKMYSAEKKIASQRYSSIKSRVIKTRAVVSAVGPAKKDGYFLEKYWKRADFINWYVNGEKKCCYCETSSEDLSKFYDSNKSKRKLTRGQSLEIERKEDTEYTEDNCKLCCYWCNNAKSDVFSFEEFTKIGQAIGLVIKEKLKTL